jgi:transposase
MWYPSPKSIDREEAVMGRKPCALVLTAENRAELERFVSCGNHPARQIRRARIALAMDGTASGEDIAKGNGVSRQTVQVVRHDFLEHGLDGILERRHRGSPPVAPKADGEYEAHLIALTRSDPPQGYARWTLRLLADKSVELGYIDSITPMTVSRVLKKTGSSLT